jgi:hypothetical protein
MALDFVVDSIDSVPEAFRGEYAEKDGKFHLNVAGLEKTYVPRSALTAANNEAAQRRHALNAWETAAGGKTHEEIASLLADIDAGKVGKGGKSKEEFDAALAQHKTESERKLTGLTQERDTAYGVARKAIVDAGLIGALTKVKATSEGLAVMPKILGDRVELKFENGEPNMKILNADGKTPMIGTGADGFATFDDLMKEVVKQYPSLFEGSGAGGGGTPSKGGKPGEKTITRSDFEKLGPIERASKVKEGFKVVD